MQQRVLSWWHRLVFCLTGVGLVLVATAEAQVARSVAPTVPQVLVATIDGEITAGTVAYVTRTLEQAAADGADYYLLELNTPGGLLKATEAISRALIASPVPTIVYVNEETGWAFSAGVFIVLSAETAAMHPTASLGAATPVLSDGGDAGTKLTNATAEWVGTLAARRERPVALAKSLVIEAETVDGLRAVELGLIDQAASSETVLFAQLGVMEYERIEVSPTVSDQILSFVSLPYLVPLLLSLGALGLVIMFRTGEVEFAGVFGVILLLLGWWGTGAITISTLGALLLGAGLVLLAVEVVFEPGFGAAGVAGVVALLLSLVTFANEPLFPSYFTSQLFYAAVGVWVAVGGIMVALGRLVLAAHLQPAFVGGEALYGRVVVVTHDLVPQGRVMIDGESYVAKLVVGESVMAGQSVQIINMIGNTVLVQPVAVEPSANA